MKNLFSWRTGAFSSFHSIFRRRICYSRFNYQGKKNLFPGMPSCHLSLPCRIWHDLFFYPPLSLAFTIEFSFNVLGLDIYRPEAGNYYSTVIWMTFAVGLAFQFPLVLLLLIRIGVLSVNKLRKSRRFVLVILMISAALITPGGDPVSLCILTIPLYFLFELSILTGALIERKISATSGKSSEPSGISGSLFLLGCLLFLGGIGTWLYLNWDKAESLFLNLSSSKGKRTSVVGCIQIRGFSIADKRILSFGVVPGKLG